jgi:ATP-dependent DNA helicase PIF1
MTELNEKQQEAVDLVKQGNNILLTGSAGTGKSFTLKTIIKTLEENNKNYGLTAMTGSAACLIGAQTLHSFMGIGLGTGTVEECLLKIRKRASVLRTLKSLDVLLIDEISMLDVNLFQKISTIIGIIKATNYKEDCLEKELIIKTPFGGIQLVFIGDFYQLPPINGLYCFMSLIWEKCNIKTVILEELIRQKDDILYQKMLRIIRKGKCTDNILYVLEKLKDTKFANGIEPTKLYPINIDVNKINADEYNKLVEKGNKSFYYKAYSNVLINENALKEYDVNLIEGAQVMITRNVDITRKLVNGTRCIIKKLNNDSVIIQDINGNYHNIEYFKDINDNNKTFICHMPVKLAYAMSIHKSQGMTINALEIDLGKNIFANGQLYTALSRGTSLKNIKIINIDKNSFKINENVKKFYSVINR